ncbi:MAG TPA: alanine--glyoxylate aminotransferase family protein [Actinomycetota bacterium]|jgi:alanine-glyoxylate transaminase/serine-glyoxylate transaminase/serine-pyruvate transaminase|nr:alanine--glyoxylate aminotransferase family protein [Actinomycetota bacterium]
MNPIPPRFEVPRRLLMGPGPSMVHPRVLQAMSNPVIGHLDPATHAMLGEIKEMLREIFRTSNDLTYAVSGTGTAGMECALTSVLEPGDVAVVLVSGFFAARMREIGRRLGGDVITVGDRWGEPIAVQEVARTLEEHPDTKAVLAVHGETSTGLYQPLPEIGELCRRQEVLFVVDAVATLGGMELDVDGWAIDVCYAGSQKCLSAPPGLAPITFSANAFRGMQSRKRPPPSFYLDALLINRYVGSERLYHHTAPISTLYALHEALRIVLEEGVEERWRRHEEIGGELLIALEDRGFRAVPPEGFRMPQLAAVWLPDGFEDRPNRERLLHEFGIEVAGGLGDFAGKVWRVGVMGESCTHENVKAFLAALDQLPS